LSDTKYKQGSTQRTKSVYHFETSGAKDQEEKCVHHWGRRKESLWSMALSSVCRMSTKYKLGKRKTLKEVQIN